MASQKQIAANRKNAAKSTGPRTQQGKARSKMNALRHGFARSTPNRWDESQLTTGVYADMDRANFEMLQNIRAERTKLLAQLLAPADSDSHNKLLRRIASLQRYDGLAYAVRKKLQRRSDSS